MDEYSERCWDVYYSKAGYADEQSVTAVRLRSGLSGIAYEAVRNIPHETLITSKGEGKDKKSSPDGVNILLVTIEGVVNKERPVRAAEMFDSVFFNSGVWRKLRERMQQYIQRRDRDFEQLKKVSSSTEVTDDIKAHLLLKFSRISAQEQSAIVSSCGNVYDLEKFKTALRMQHHAIHERDRVDRDRHRPEGKGRPWRTTWAVEEDEQQWPPEEGDDEQEGQEGSQEDDLEGDDDFGESILDGVEVSDLTQEQAESFAVVMQARKGKGKGKGKGRKGKSRPPQGADGPPPLPAGGEDGQRQDRENAWQS